MATAVSTMRRRRFLASAGVVGTGGLAGCSVPDTSTRMDDPTVRPEDGETHLIYRDEGGRVAAVTVQYGPVRDQVGAMLPMRYSLWHRDGTTVEDLTVSVRSRSASQQVPPQVYVASPGGDFPPIHFGRNPDLDARTIAIPEIQRVGTGTVTLEWVLRPFDDEWPVELAVETDASLSSGLLGGYVLEGTTELAIEASGAQA